MRKTQQGFFKLQEDETVYTPVRFVESFDSLVDLADKEHPKKEVTSDVEKQHEEKKLCVKQ